MSKIIQWRPGHQVKCDAIRVHDELEKIRKRDGDLTIDAVYKQAAKPSSEMHKECLWDEKEAAVKYNKFLLRRMMGAIQVILIQAPKAPVKMYSVVLRPDPDPKVKKPIRVYASTEEALADPNDRSHILGNAIRDALAFRRKYAALQELSQVIQVIDTFIAQAKG